MSYLPGARPRRRFTAPKIGVLVLLIAAIAFAAYIAFKPSNVEHRGETVGFSAPPEPKAKPIVVIVRSAQTACSVSGGCNENNYTQVLASKVGWQETTLTANGAGYVASKSAGSTNYGSLVPDIIAAKPSLVLIEGSRFDRFFDNAQIQSAAIQVFQQVQAGLPSAKIIVVGPILGGADSGVAAANSALKTAATGRVALFIDPIAEKWFTGANAKLEADDGKTFTDAGHVYLATQIAADLKKAGLD